MTPVLPCAALRCAAFAQYLPSGPAQAYLNSLLAEEVGGGVQHISCMAGVVVGVTGVVVGLDHLQPRPERGLGAAQELTHTKAREDL